MFCRNTSKIALINAINDYSNYPSGNYINWDFVEAYMLVELYGPVTLHRTIVPSLEYYTWFDRAVGLYIDEFGEPTKDKADGTRLGEE